jgi:hypothetical protein
MLLMLLMSVSNSWKKKKKKRLLVRKQFKKRQSMFGHKHTKPPKNCSHKYIFSIITSFGNVWTSHFDLFLFV